MVPTWATKVPNAETIPWKDEAGSWWCKNQDPVLTEARTLTGRLSCRYQCRECGRKVSEVLKRTLVANAGVPRPLDAELQEAGWKRQREEADKAYQAIRDAIRYHWPLRFMPYEQYLQTDEWKERSRRIKSRDGHKCVHCGGHREIEVHHLTYERRGYERDDDLVTLCRDCHARLHGKN